MKTPNLIQIFALLILSTVTHGQQLEVFTDLSVPQVDFIIEELESACTEGVSLSGYEQISKQKSSVSLVLGMVNDPGISLEKHQQY